MARTPIDLSARTCPNREERLGSIKAFYGEADELIGTASRGVPWRNRAFQQNGGCVNSSTMQRLATVRDGVIVSHAAIGCSAMIYGYREVYQNIPGAERPPADFHWISTNLKENDLVFGGEGKLARTIREAEARYHPEAIFILSSCASGIVEDDLEGVVAPAASPRSGSSRPTPSASRSCFGSATAGCSSPLRWRSSWRAKRRPST